MARASVWRNISSASLSTALALVLASTSPASARSRIEVGDLVVDGQAVRDLRCDLEKGGFFAGAAIVGALAKQHKAIAACAPAGDAARLSFTFSAGKTVDIAVVAAANAPVGECIKRALAQVASTDVGTCSATILTADNDLARKAAAALTPPNTPVDPKKSQPLQPTPSPK
jgi:hypothetical protein